MACAYLLQFNVIEKVYSEQGNIKTGKHNSGRKQHCGFFKHHRGQASLEEISEGLGILKYGSNSAYALRVPKIVRFRPDKKVEEIDSLEKISKLYEMQYGRYPFKSLEHPF